MAASRNAAAQRNVQKATEAAYQSIDSGAADADSAVQFVTQVHGPEIEKKLRQIMIQHGLQDAVDEAGEKGSWVTQANRDIESGLQDKADIGLTKLATREKSLKAQGALDDLLTEHKLGILDAKKVNADNFDAAIERTRKLAETSLTLPTVVQDLAKIPTREQFLDKLATLPPSQVQQYHEWLAQADPKKAQAVGEALTEHFARAAFGPNGDPQKAFSILSSTGQYPDRLAAAFGGGADGTAKASRMQQFAQDVMLFEKGGKQKEVMNWLRNLRGPAAAGALLGSGFAFNPSAFLHGATGPISLAVAGYVTWKTLIRQIAEDPKFARQFSQFVADGGTTEQLKKFPALINFVAKYRVGPEEKLPYEGPIQIPPPPGLGGSSVPPPPPPGAPPSSSAPQPPPGASAPPQPGAGQPPQG
jgi:hypothetical protein